MFAHYFHFYFILQICIHGFRFVDERKVAMLLLFKKKKDEEGGL